MPTLCCWVQQVINKLLIIWLINGNFLVSGLKLFIVDATLLIIKQNKKLDVLGRLSDPLLNSFYHWEYLFSSSMSVRILGNYCICSMSVRILGYNFICSISVQILGNSSIWRQYQNQFKYINPNSFIHSDNSFSFSINTFSNTIRWWKLPSLPKP